MKNNGAPRLQSDGPGDHAAVVCGIGAWVPPCRVTNDDLASRLDTSDEWIRTRTGIRQRFVVPPGMSTAHLAMEAGDRALKSAGITEVHAVVLGTTTPDRPCPATAPEVADRLGLTGTPAFDVSAVCSGFLYGLAVGSGLISSGTAERVLVIGAEAFSTILDPHDRATVSVFGDGAGAMVLRRGHSCESGALGGFSLGSDGSLADLITVRAGGSLQRSTGDEPRSEDTFFTMQGKLVFTHAVTKMVESAKAALDLVNWRIDQIDWFVGHQANLRILRAVAEQLDLDPSRLIIYLDQVGNTAAASIPLALENANATATLRPGQRIVLAAFGGGATWGATTLVWPELTVV